MTDASAFQELAALLLLIAAFGIVGLVLRQPLIVAFIAAGIVAGGDALGLIRSTEQIDLLAEIGVAVLLFLVGLKLDVQIIRSLGKVAAATGLGQVMFTAGIGFIICLLLAIDAVTSAYVAVALTFSSTIIVVKLLSDKRELETLHGRIALGFLIVQDIVVVAAMVTISALGAGGDDQVSRIGPFVFVAGSIGMLVLVGVFVRYLAEPLLRVTSRSPELLVTFSLAWAVLFAATTDWLGFGKELGGLLAGVALASTTYREAIATRLVSLRDFLLLFFFVALGSRLDLGVLGQQVPAALVLSLFVLIGNPLIVMAIMGVMGYRKRTGFLAGLTVAQISEFSLVFIAMGLALGHVQPEAVGLVTLVGLVTITLSTYMILYSGRLYRLVEPWLSIFERRSPVPELGGDAPSNRAADVILFGLGRYGQAMLDILEARGIRVLGIDNDPEAVLRSREDREGAAIYGDAEDAEFLATLPLASSRHVIVATSAIGRGVTHEDSRAGAIKGLRESGFKGRIAVRCVDEADGERMRRAGADVALFVFGDAAALALDRLGIETLRTKGADDDLPHGS